MQYPFYEWQLRQQYRLLGHQGYYTQGHCHDVINNRLVSRELLYGEEKVIKWAKENNGKGNVFLGRNPRNSDGSILYATCLSLDIDPQRDKGTAATNEQFVAAIHAANVVVRDRTYGCVCSSGNGALCLFKLPEPVSAILAERWGKALEEYARKLLNGSAVNVDSTFDCARLVKAMGTISTKGDPSLWRHAKFINAGVRVGEGSNEFLNWLKSIDVPSQATSVLPEITKGELDRSKTDFAIAVRLKAQGFGAEDTFRALCSYATRPGREDDYKRIVEKVYFEKQGSQKGSEEARPIELWTPENGLSGYLSRPSQTDPELPTGFTVIDKATHGLERGHIFTVGGRTNTGKTTFATCVSVGLCERGASVLLVSTESIYREIWDRFIACATSIPAFALQHRSLNNTDEKRINAYLQRFRQYKFHIYDGSRPSIHTLRQAVTTSTPDVLIFDYFQHIESRETRELEEFVMQVKELAKEHNIAVLMTAQLHDRYDMKTGKMFPPTLQDMKNCKVLNDESRVVLLLDWDRDKAVDDGPAAVKCIMAKNKGPKTDCVLRLDRRIPKFTEEL